MLRKMLVQGIVAAIVVASAAAVYARFEGAPLPAQAARMEEED